MAGWIFLGGILNLLGLAYPLALDSIVLFGLAYSALIFLRSWRLQVFATYRKQYFSKDYLLRFLPGAIAIFVVFLFVAYTISSPKAFNFHDDLEKYLSHPMRMLTTGSLRGSPFNALGSETLGGQAFLHGFAAAHWPIGYVNTADSVLAFILCLMMIHSVALRAGLSSWFTLLIVLVPIFINPQYVNISALYTASALMLLLFFGPWIDAKEYDSSLSTWRSAAWIGLVYSALIVLKTVYLLLVIIHFAVFFAGLMSLSRSLKDAVSWATKVIASGILSILSWILLYYSNWISWLSAMSAPHTSLLDGGYYRYTKKAINIVSLDPLFYGFGTTFAHYTVTMILVGFFGIFLLLYKLPNQPEYNKQTLTELAAWATTPILYFASVVLIAPILLGPDEGLRYACPAIIAGVPSTLIIASTRVSESIQGNHLKNRLGKYPLVIFALFSIGIIGSFSSSFAERGEQAWLYGSLLSFPQRPRDPEYIAYNRFALSSAAKEEIQKAQQFIPQGEPLIAWTPLALQLDYRRNRIIDIDPAGLANPWVDFPFGRESSDGVKYFINGGACYILWQYRSYAVRPVGNLIEEAASPYPRSHTIGVRTHQFLKMLYAMTKDSQILGNNGSIVVIKLLDKDSQFSPKGIQN